MSQKPCHVCVEVRDNPVRRAAHVVHPRTHEPQLFDIYCEAICPTCYTIWRRNCDNSLEIVA